MNSRFESVPTRNFYYVYHAYCYFTIIIETARNSKATFSSRSKNTVVILYDQITRFLISRFPADIIPSDIHTHTHTLYCVAAMSLLERAKNVRA